MFVPPGQSGRDNLCSCLLVYKSRGIQRVIQRLVGESDRNGDINRGERESDIDHDRKGHGARQKVSHAGPTRVRRSGKGRERQWERRRWSTNSRTRCEREDVRRGFREEGRRWNRMRGGPLWLNRPLSCRSVFCSLRSQLEVWLLEWLEDERSLWRLGHLRTSTEIVMKNAICQHRAQDVTSEGEKSACKSHPQSNIRRTAAHTVLRGSATSNLPSSNVGVERAMRHITMSLISGG